MKKMIFIVFALLGCSCSLIDEKPNSKGVRVKFEEKAWSGVPDECATRSSIDESSQEKLSDVNLFAFRNSESGYVYDASCSGYYSSLREMSLDLDKSFSYRLFAFANAGKDVTAEAQQFGNVDDFSENFRYGITEYRSSFDGKGLPMSGIIDVPEGQQDEVVITLTRLYSRWFVKINTDELSFSKLQVKSLKIENAPCAVYPFCTASRSRKSEDSAGEDNGDQACASDLEALAEGRGIYLYILENAQGKLLENWQEKIPSELEDSGYGQMVEDGLLTSIKMEVAADTPWATYDNVCFRTYLGENTQGNFSILRNTPRNLTLHICRDKITESEWRIEPGVPVAEFNPGIKVTLKSHLNTRGAWAPYLKVECTQCEKLMEIYGDFLPAIGISITASSQHTASVIYRNKFQWLGKNSTLVANGGRLVGEGSFISEYTAPDGSIRSSYYSNDCELALGGYEREAVNYSARDGNTVEFHPCDTENIGDADSFLSIVSPHSCSAYSVFTETYDHEYEPRAAWYWEWIETDYIDGHNSVFTTVTFNIPQRILSAVESLYGKKKYSFIKFTDELEKGWPYKIGIDRLGWYGADFEIKTE